MKFRALVVFLIVSLNAVFSQEIGQEIRGGKLYKIHIIEAGNTLYGLHVKYEVPIDEIIDANPHLEEGLRIGQKIYIPTDETAGEKSSEKSSFTIHIVEKKETLFGISRKYETSVEAIIELNPEAEKGLSIGQELKIPIVKIEKEETPHVPIKEVEVEKKDTVFNNISSQSKEIQPILNAAIQDSTIKVGDTISRITRKIEFTDSIIDYKVKKGETLYSIANRFMVPIEQIVKDNELKNYSIKPDQIIRIKLKKERITEVEVKEIYTEKLDSILRERPNLIEAKNRYNILVALPMKLSENPHIISGVYDDLTKLNNLTDLSVSFMMGAQMALDSLQKLGLVANVEFYDTEGNLEKFKSFLSEKNASDFDLIVGPFYENLMEYTASWGKQNKVPVIAVTKISTKLMENNPFVISTVPSNLTLISGMAKYLAKHHANDNIVIIEGQNEEEKNKVDYFSNTFNRYSNNKFINTLKKTSIGESSGRTLADKIIAGKQNFYICLSENEPTVMRFVNALNAAKNSNSTAKKEKVTLVGMSDWQKFPSLNNYYKNRFEYHFPATNYLNYDRPEVNEFAEEFRKKYGSDPSRYAIHGFDVVLSQLSRLLLEEPRNTGLMDVFSIQPVGRYHGSENSAVFISKQEEFEIRLLEIVTY